MTKIHCRGLFEFCFLVFLGDSLSLWSSRTISVQHISFMDARVQQHSTLLEDWDGSSGAIFPDGIPDKGKDKRESVKFDSVTSFFLCSQHPVQSHTLACRPVYS